MSVCFRDRRLKFWALYSANRESFWNITTRGRGIILKFLWTNDFWTTVTVFICVTIISSDANNFPPRLGVNVGGHKLSEWRMCSRWRLYGRNAISCREFRCRCASEIVAWSVKQMRVAWFWKRFGILFNLRSYNLFGDLHTCKYSTFSNQWCFNNSS